jgi:hypothetical protein
MAQPPPPAAAAAALAREDRVESLRTAADVEPEPEAEPESEPQAEPAPEAEPEPAPLTCADEPGRGWCYRASRELPAGTALLCSAPDIAALYTDHVAGFCASCFRRAAPDQGVPLAACAGCQRFALCSACDEGGALRRWHEADECAAFQKIPAVRFHSPPPPLSIFDKCIRRPAHGQAAQSQRTTVRTTSLHTRDPRPQQ